MTKLTDHFTTQEMQCPTSGIVRFQSDFLERLEVLRCAYDKPMIINSGCRSYLHNEQLIQDGLPASKNSLHLIGNRKYGTDTIAVDVAKPNIYDQAILIKIALEQGWTVRVGSSFIHLDLREVYTDLEAHFDTY